jgi:hypothetical protein
MDNQIKYDEVLEFVKVGKDEKKAPAYAPTILQKKPGYICFVEVIDGSEPDKHPKNISCSDDYRVRFATLDRLLNNKIKLHMVIKHEDYRAHFKLFEAKIERKRAKPGSEWYHIPYTEIWNIIHELGLQSFVEIVNIQ